MPDDGEIIQGHVIDVLRSLPAESVQCAVTSPPYWGLRNYNLPATVWGGDPECAHEWGEEQIVSGPAQAQGVTSQRSGRANIGAQSAKGRSQGQVCLRCNAWRGQLGLEPTPDLYVAHIVEVFREVRRVLRPDGTLWLNMGDCYANDGKWGGETGGKQAYLDDATRKRDGREKRRTGLKPKDLVGMPWRVAFALQADGWWLRCDVIWHKPNPMPESCRDRPTKAHEYVFLLTKAARYFYDADAVREAQTDPFAKYPRPRTTPKYEAAGHGNRSGANRIVPGGRNLRSVWTIPTQPCSYAHYATFPTALAERCILAGTSERGCCPECGAPWERVVDAKPNPSKWASDTNTRNIPADRMGGNPQSSKSLHRNRGGVYREAKTLGWRPTCSCPTADSLSPTPCTVLDPFAGTGTVALVAKRLGRHYIGIELNPKDCEYAATRLRNQEANLFAAPSTQTPPPAAVDTQAPPPAAVQPKPRRPRPYNPSPAARGGDMEDAHEHETRASEV